MKGLRIDLWDIFGSCCYGAFSCNIDNHLIYILRGAALDSEICQVRACVYDLISPECGAENPCDGFDDAVFSVSKHQS